MVLQVNEVLVKHGLNTWVIVYAKDEGGHLSTMTTTLIFLYHVRYYGWQHHLWEHVGGMPCLSVANSYRWLQSLCSFNLYFYQGSTIHFVENYHMDRKKWEGTTKVAHGMYGFWCAPREAQDSYESHVCFLSHFVSRNFGIQTHNCLMLWKATLIGPSRPCAKSTSLGYRSNCCKYFGSRGSTMCVE